MDDPLVNGCVCHRIPRPNKFKIIHMDIPIVRWTSPESGEIKEDMVFCTDILDALTQDFFARKGNPIEEPPHVEEVKVGTLILSLFFQRLHTNTERSYNLYTSELANIDDDVTDQIRTKEYPIHCIYSL